MPPKLSQGGANGVCIGGCQASFGASLRSASSGSTCSIAVNLFFMVPILALFVQRVWSMILRIGVLQRDKYKVIQQLGW